jgi:hypothetical protein
MNEQVNLLPIDSIYEEMFLIKESVVDKGMHCLSTFLIINKYSI